MDFQNLLSTIDIGSVDHHMTVESPGSEKSGIQNLRSVGGGHDNHPWIGVKTIHLRQELIECLLLFVVSPHGIDPARLSEGIQFVNENNTGSMVLSLSKEVPDSCCSHSDNSLYDIKTTNGEKRDVRLSSHGSGEQGFSCSRHSHQEDSFRNLPTEALKLSRRFKKLHNLFHFLFRLINSSHIGKGDLFLFLRIDFCPALSKGHTTCLRADSRKENSPEDKEEDKRNDPRNNVGQPFAINLPCIFDMVSL